MFPIVLLGAKTKTGLELALKCIEFSGTESVNSEEPVLKFKYAVLAQSLEPFRKIQAKDEQGELLFEEDGTTPIFLPPTLEDYYYETLSDGYKDYSNQTLRQDLEIVNGIPQPAFEQAKDELDNLLFEEDGTTPIMIPVMIGNIDFWLKWGGQGIIADLYFTVGQIKQEPIETFYK